MWKRALGIFTRYQAHYEQAQLHFYLAALAHRRGDPEAARAHIETSLELARSYGYEYLFVQDAAWAAPPLLPLALEGDPFATRVFTRLGEPALKVLLPVLEERGSPSRRSTAHGWSSSFTS